MRRSFILLSFFFLHAHYVCSQTYGDLSRIGIFTYGGLPKSKSTEQKVKTLINLSYISAYDEELKNPIWTAYRLGNLKGSTPLTKWERPWMFLPDYRTDTRIGHDSYTSSGYDRGHMAPNAAMLEQYGQLAQLETFLMTNICPQRPELNQRLWAKLEDLERSALSQDDTPNKEVHDLFVITGPVFSAKPDTLKSGVAIPDSFFRIMAYKRGYLGTLKAVAYIIPQRPTFPDLSDYYVTIDKIEQLTGLDFFAELTERVQRNLESKKRDIELNDIL